jgi:protein TonB
MIVRKYPSADIGKFENLFFGIGLSLSLLLVVTAFEWKFYDDGSLANLDTNINSMFDEILDIPPTVQPPPPPPSQSKFTELVEVPDVEEIEENIDINLDIEVTEEMVIEQMEIETPEIVEEEAEEIFTVVENQPLPVGGYEAFYSYIYQEIKYPTFALRSNVEGRVFVQFVVEKDGTLTDFVIVRGIGAGCDQEALRVLKGAPNWQPGKQRGKPVRVRMILPITFKISGDTQ